jgi:integral membrane protein
MKDSLSRFRRIAILEGWSFILLLFIAMPLKYWAEWPYAVKYTGWIHGLLFVIYCIFLLQTAIAESWNIRKWIVAFLAAWIPFGTFWLEKKIKANPGNWS